jgi:hypothetical protein
LRISQRFNLVYKKILVSILVLIFLKIFRVYTLDIDSVLILKRIMCDHILRNFDLIVFFFNIINVFFFFFFFISCYFLVFGEYAKFDTK